MTEEKILRGWQRGGTAPNPAAYGLHFPKMQTMLEKQQEIWLQTRELNSRYKEVQARIHQLERDESSAWADAIVAGEAEPSDKELRKARETLEKIAKRQAATQKALDKVNGKIVSFVGENGGDWQRQVDARGEEALARVEDAVATLKGAVAEIHTLASLKRWLENPKRSFAPSEGSHHLQTFSCGEVSTDEVYAALLQDATDMVRPPHPVTRAQAPGSSPGTQDGTQLRQSGVMKIANLWTRSE